MKFITMMSLTFLSLLPIINPVGMSSSFLGLTKHLSPQERHFTAYKVAVYSFILLSCVLFFGKIVLEFFGLTLPFIRIAGGLLVSFTGWGMLTSKSKLSQEEKFELKTNKGDDLAFFPLTLPLTAGAGAIAITVSIALGIPSVQPDSELIQLYSGAVVGILGNAILVAICYRCCDFIFLKIGKTGVIVITSLSAFILVALGFSVMWNGIISLIIIAKHIN